MVGGMETRFQCVDTLPFASKHAEGMSLRYGVLEIASRTAKCEAFHVAPRLFFMFLFLIPSTIRQQCIIYLQEFSTEP